jgi:hypothetical protein
MRWKYIIEVSKCDGSPVLFTSRNPAKYRMSRVQMFASYFCMGKHVPMPLYEMVCVFHSYRIGREFDITILVPI